MCLMSATVFCQSIEPQLFSVSETKQVVFSKGNLVYNQNTKKYDAIFIISSKLIFISCLAIDFIKL